MRPPPGFAKVVKLGLEFLLPVHQVACIVPIAAGSTVSFDGRILERSANLLGAGPEVIHGAGVVRQNVASRDEDAVDVDTLAAVWQMDRVVECRLVMRVLKAVQVPVYMRAEHYGCCFGGGCVHAHVPCVGREGIRDVGADCARKAFAAIRIGNGECYGRWVEGHHFKGTLACVSI